MIALVGVIHLVVIPEYLVEAAYVGRMCFAKTVGAGVSACGIRRGAGWGWDPGALISLASSFKYISTAPSSSLGRWASSGRASSIRLASSP